MITFVAEHPEQFEGHVVGNGHCVAFVRSAADALHTAQWRRGPLVRGGKHPTGTAIATFDVRGRYANETDGSSHAAILLEETEAGLRVMEQWQGQPVHQRTIRPKGGKAPACDDADAYHVIIIDDPAAA